MRAMSGFEVGDSLPKLGHVTDLRERWLVRADGALAHRLQDREISAHLYENKYRNQQIREDFPVALNEQKGIEDEARVRELARCRQAEKDAEIAREMAEINIRRERRQRTVEISLQPSSSRAVLATHVSESVPFCSGDFNADELGLSPSELDEMRQRLIQEEKDLRLARELSHENQDCDALLVDMRCAVEAQDGELARLLQEREYKKLQRAKEKARQRALQKKQQRLADQQRREPPQPSADAGAAALCDAYSCPLDVIRQNSLRLSKSVDSDLNYVEPFEKEHIQSKASALQDKRFSTHGGEFRPSSLESDERHDRNTLAWQNAATQHRHPPPPPLAACRKPRFPDPVSIRPASHYPSDGPAQDGADSSKRLSVMSEITVEGFEKRRSKKELNKKKMGCKIQ